MTPRRLSDAATPLRAKTTAYNGVADSMADVRGLIDERQTGCVALNLREGSTSQQPTIYNSTEKTSLHVTYTWYMQVEVHLISSQPCSVVSRQKHRSDLSASDKA